MVGAVIILYFIFHWLVHVARESIKHNLQVLMFIFIAISMFIFSESLLFAGMFWTHYHILLSTTFPIGVILPSTINVIFVSTAILLLCGLLNSVHIIMGQSTIIPLVIISAYIFVCFEATEFRLMSFFIVELPSFYLLLSLHFLHVVVGLFIITVSYYKSYYSYFGVCSSLATITSNVSICYSVWWCIYWHFVEVLWLFISSTAYIHLTIIN